MPAYRVPTVPTLEGRIIEGKKEGGRTVPLEIICFAEDGHSERYVVKFHGDATLGHEGLAREMVGALLGHYFRLPIPRVAVINIPAQLHATTRDNFVSEKLLKSPGLNFGSRLVETGLYPFRLLKETDRQTATDIFAFDMLIQNVDRRTGKPNVYQTADGLVIIDHEMAFPYSRPGIFVGGVPEPWQLAAALKFTDHPFYAHLHGNHTPLDTFEERLRELNAGLFEQIAAQVPTGWRSGALDNIWAYLNRARDASERFIRSLKEALSK